MSSAHTSFLLAIDGLTCDTYLVSVRGRLQSPRRSCERRQTPLVHPGRAEDLLRARTPHGLSATRERSQDRHGPHADSHPDRWDVPVDASCHAERHVALPVLLADLTGERGGDQWFAARCRR